MAEDLRQKLKLPGPIPRPKPSNRPPRHRNGQAFLKGPIPWDWWTKAGHLRGTALQVASILWREAGCTNRRTVRFNLRSAAAMGLPISTARRGLRSLQAAHLVRVKRSPGRCLEVEIRDAGTPD